MIEGCSTLLIFEYIYDAMGNRIQKRLYSQGDDRPPVITRYVRDAQGSTMAVYTETYEGQDARQIQNEAHLYGASRLGIKKANVEYTQSFNGNYINDRFDNLSIGWSASFEYCPATYTQTDPESKVANTYNRQLGDKVYELSNHLGNVQVTITDGKYTDQSHSENWMPTIASFTDYYPFGMEIVERTWSMDEYRYGFNGKENDNEVKGSGHSVDFGARIYDSRLGRWLSVDPLTSKYSMLTPFHFANNRPIWMVDIGGLEGSKYDEWKSLTQEEKKILVTNFWIASQLEKNRALAEQKTNELFKGTESEKTGFHNDEADAFRHAYFNALNTQSFGRELANDLGKAHEQLDDPTKVKQNEKKMDLHNNAIGQDIGAANPKATPDELAMKVEEQRKAGKLVVFKDPTDDTGKISPLVPSNKQNNYVVLRDNYANPSPCQPTSPTGDNTVVIKTVVKPEIVVKK